MNPTMSVPARVGKSVIDVAPDEFRAMGHQLVDDIALFLEGIANRPVSPGLKPSEIRARLGAPSIPERGADPATILAEATRLLFDSSTFNGHPRFFGYITAPASPIGIFGDMLATAVNQNCGAWILSPAAAEIELQTISWMAELTGFPGDCGGIFVSGGNMANMVCFLAALKRHDREPQHAERKLRCYASVETHTWIDKAADLSGIGPESVTRLPVDARGRINAQDLRAAILADRDAGAIPSLVIATAGSTNTGAIDPLADIADVCSEEGLWLHVDGAYGAPVAALPDAPPDLLAISRADSLAIDPHKWLYAPLEAGCALVRNKEDLRTAFSHAPHYYHFEEIEGEAGTNFYELGPQNSRGFRALKVWLAMKHVGRAGHVEMIAQDIALAEKMYHAVQADDRLEARTCELSIVTFRFVPGDLRSSDQVGQREYLNRLNETLLTALQAEGEVFVSNAIVDGDFLLRACIVNFRTTVTDVLAVPEIVARTGERVDRELRGSVRG